MAGTDKRVEVMLEDNRPLIGITMGDPVGIGPEVILKALDDMDIYRRCRPLVLGDPTVMESMARRLDSPLSLNVLSHPDQTTFAHGRIGILALSDLSRDETAWGKPTVRTGSAMVAYIERAVDMTQDGLLQAMVTAPVNKASMQMSGSAFAGHTELLAQRTGTEHFAMMMAGDRLRVVLATIHIPLRSVPERLTPAKILTALQLTHNGLLERFGMQQPRIAVAGLNPHAGEEGLFGKEEQALIRPAIDQALSEGIQTTGPYPPDTVFYHAAAGRFDAVVCMYHDQGLIPFKMLHFNDGVNTTLGLPIIRTSVDHGTAYDIAGSGAADPGSMKAAIRMAAEQADRYRAWRDAGSSV